jgi:hypothetical protein
MVRRKNYPPGRIAIPIIGDALWSHLKEGQAYNRRMFAKYGPTWCDTMLGRRIINLSRYEDIKKVLASEHDLVEGGLSVSLLCWLSGSMALLVLLAGLAALSCLPEG